MDTADYILLRQCVPNARFASAAPGNSLRTAACSATGAITPRNRNFARMRRRMAAAAATFTAQRSNRMKSHTTAQEQSLQATSSTTTTTTRISSEESTGPSCNVMDDDIETEIVLLEQVLLRHTSEVAQFQHSSAFVGDD